MPKKTDVFADLRDAVQGETIALRYIPLDEAVLWDDNPKDHDIGALVESIRVHGFRDPMTYDSTLGAFVEGHGRTFALAAMRDDDMDPPRGIGVHPELGWCIPVLFGVDAASREAAEAYAVAHNRLTFLGGWDDKKLALVLMDVREASQELFHTTGYDDQDLAYLLQDAEQEYNEESDEVQRPDDIPAKELRTRLGQIWRIASKSRPGLHHRLAVADSSDEDAVSNLFMDKLAAMMWTDPPYGVDYEGKTAEALTIENDSADGTSKLLAAVWQITDPHLAEGCPFYICHPHGVLSLTFGQSVLNAGWHFHQTLVWVKNSMVMGHSDHHYQHEPILYGWKKGKPRPWYGERTKVSTFFVDRPARSADHPTMKPVKLIVPHLRNSSLPGDIVYDPFLGSGSTMMAAELEGRVCYGIELTPSYAEVVLRRMEEHGCHVALET